VPSSTAPQLDKPPRTSFRSRPTPTFADSDDDDDDEDDDEVDRFPTNKSGAALSDEDDDDDVGRPTAPAEPSSSGRRRMGASLAAAGARCGAAAQRSLLALPRRACCSRRLLWRSPRRAARGFAGLVVGVNSLATAVTPAFVRDAADEVAFATQKGAFRLGKLTGKVVEGVGLTGPPRGASAGEALAYNTASASVAPPSSGGGPPELDGLRPLITRFVASCPYWLRLDEAVGRYVALSAQLAETQAALGELLRRVTARRCAAARSWRAPDSGSARHASLAARPRLSWAPTTARHWPAASLAPRTAPPPARAVRCPLI